MSHLNKINIEQSLLALGIASAEYLCLEKETSIAKYNYGVAKNEFIEKNFDEFCVINWEELINDDDFLEATSDLYKTFKEKKRQKVNAKRRLDTKFSQYKKAVRLGGV